MKNITKTTSKILLLFLSIYCLNIQAQAPTIEWQKTFGGTNYEELKSTIQTTDGGYILAGNALSNDGDITANHGNYDVWIVKTSSTGAIEWQKTFGGTGDDEVFKLIKTTDGGYIVAGYSNSTNGDVTGNHGDYDCWIVKISVLGSIEWQKSYGGTAKEYAFDIVQTTDGGYAVSGYSNSINGDITANHGLNDIWIIKTSSTGVIEWQKTFGGTGNDESHKIIQTLDGGYILAGTSNSTNGDITANHGDFDYWIVKINATGVIEWQKTFGGTGDDESYSIQLADDGYIVSGTSNSNNGDVVGNHGVYDVWIIKMNTTGIIEWQKTLGGTGSEFGRCIVKTTDGGYVVAGESTSNNGDVTGNHGSIDCWIAKISATGAMLWQKSLGGTGIERALSISQTIDTGFIVGGYTNSNNGDVTANHGSFDCWIVKLNPENLLTNSFAGNTMATLFPNPTKENITLKLNYYTPSQEMSITNVLGKTITSQKLDGLSTTINTSSLEKGIYFLNVIDGSNKISKKFIKD